MLKKLLFFLFTILMSINIIAGEVTITPENCGWTTSASAQDGTVGCINISVTNGLADGQLRIYKNETLTISSDSTITSIVFTCTSNGTAKYGPGCFAEQEGYTYEVQGKTGTWLGNAKTVTFTAETNQVRATNILIMFNDSVTPDTTSQDTTIIPPVTPTQLDTITCDSARIAALAGKKDSVLVKGFVTEIATAWNSQFSNISFWMADTENGGQVFEGFRVACATEEEAPNVGDLVWIKGKLTTFHDTVPELAAGGKFGIILRADVDTVPEDTIVPPVLPVYDITYNFNEISFEGWTNSYAEHVIEYAEATVAFEAASKQGSTINDIPVTKGQPVVLFSKNNKTISDVFFKCRQWNDKNQKITLSYSTDGAETFNEFEPSVTSTDFTIGKTQLPTGVNAVRMTFSNKSNQIGVESVTFNFTSETPTDLSNVETNKKFYKMFDGKQVIIVRGDKKFNILGQEL